MSVNVPLVGLTDVCLYENLYVSKRTIGWVD